ncbi:hypothetical protein GCM10010994_33050 [Chelatococcus reniformis]|uniref:Uncharacterized protein n=1 Tax=Chelatococcus reniformis TaxID=1494448 RepID=A0A916UGH9_9HYPH|nr:hypothetical protein GCM10010994_33050 [Chelatococcus reniformis]
MARPGQVPSEDPLTKADGGRSFDVVKRVAFKLTFFLLAAGLQAAAGLGFVAPLAVMALASSALCMFIGTWREERIGAPHYTSFDEGVWLFFLGYGAHRFL